MDVSSSTSLLSAGDNATLFVTMKHEVVGNISFLMFSALSYVYGSLPRNGSISVKYQF